ncbi:MAG: tetratricopeptide repeat protein [Planctomycetota bacterium]|nr:tetratricopeptide repeat protein [Planctomycetota bacterium]
MHRLAIAFSALAAILPICASGTLPAGEGDGNSAAEVGRDRVVEAAGAAARLKAGREAWARGDAIAREIKALERSGGLEDDALAAKAEKMAAAYMEAERLLSEAASAMPGEGAAAFGEFLYRRKRFREARTVLEGAIKALGAAEGGEKQGAGAGEAARLRLLLGGTLERAGRTEDALRLYREAAAIAPEEAAPFEHIAAALAFRGDFREALDDLARGGAAASGSPFAMYIRGVCLESLWRLKEAQEAYGRAGAMAAKSGTGDLAAACSEAAERVAAAIAKTDAKAWERIEEASALLAHGEKLAAGAQGDRKKHEAAIQALKSAVGLWPPFAAAHYRLGALYLSEEQYAAARSHLEAAALYEPRQPAYLKAHAQVLLALGQFEEAIRVLGRLLILDPESGPAHFGLARAHGLLRASPRDLEVALMDLDRAGQLGVEVPPRMRERFLEVLEELRARGSGGETAPEPTGPAGTERHGRRDDMPAGSGSGGGGGK